MQQLLENAGYETVPFEEGADVYVINTCTVTNIADRKSRQMLHKAKKMNPDAIVVATGCYAQADTEKLKEDTAVDLILGNNQKTQIVEALEEYEKEHAKQVQVIEINHTKEYEELSISSTAEHVRAYIKVQDGCNQFCTYCIIPFARGRVRSRKIEEVLREVENTCCKRLQGSCTYRNPFKFLWSGFPERRKRKSSFTDSGSKQSGRNQQDSSWLIGAKNYHRRISGRYCENRKSVSAFSFIPAERMQ